VLFRLRMAGSFSVRRTVGAAGCGAAGALGAVLPAAAVGALLVGILVGVIVAERLAAARRRARGEPSPLERLDGLTRAEQRGRGLAPPWRR
jgi:hypothetical protein